MENKVYKNEEILNKGCQVRFGKDLYYCYNTTTLMHFVKCGAKGQILKPNAKNMLNMKKDQVLSLIKLGSAFIEVGNI